jgi:hypothetical protein
LGGACSKFSFIYVPYSKMHCYEQLSLFGEDVSIKFPGVSLDIEKAGKCLALGQSTAAVFHCMRTLEAGLDGIACYLGIGKQKPWMEYIQRINRKSKERQRKNPPKMYRNKRELINLMGVLVDQVRQVWRNSTKHLVGHLLCP